MLPLAPPPSALLSPDCQHRSLRGSQAAPRPASPWQAPLVAPRPAAAVVFAYRHCILIASPGATPARLRCLCRLCPCGRRHGHHPHFLRGARVLARRLSRPRRLLCSGSFSGPGGTLTPSRRALRSGPARPCELFEKGPSHPGRVDARRLLDEMSTRSMVLGSGDFFGRRGAGSDYGDRRAGAGGNGGEDLVWRWEHVHIGPPCQGRLLP
ncbi:unnamed protein product [Urochloa humidicola]